MIPEQLQIEEWHNYGDVNPDLHGGLFIRYAGSDDFDVIETYPAEEIYNDREMESLGYTEDTQLVMRMYVEDLDIFDRWDNPTAGFSENLYREMDRSGNLRFQLETIQNDPDAMQWGFENHPEDILGHIAHFASAYIESRENTTEDYWGYLTDNYGITKEVC